MPKKFVNGLRIFLLYWLCCLIIGLLATLLSIGALVNSHFRLSKASSIVARGALFPYIQLSKMTGTTTFQAWEKGLTILEDIPSFAQKLQELQKTYTDHAPLDPDLIPSIQTEYSYFLSEWSSLQNLISQSWPAKAALKQTKYSTFTEVFNKNESVLLSNQLFLNFVAQKFEQNQPVNLLILFQNNMELRPTGGFIGSYGILHLAKNEPITLEIQDIYVPDGQLKEHVDPPLPIQEAFQQGFWKLRDANWHPDFPESVKRVEWFFSQVNATTFDGVISLTFTPIQKLLTITGPIHVPDLQTDITHENVYQILQRVDNQTFFPGSTEKKDTLTAFSNQLLIQLQRLPPEKYIDVLTLINHELTEKNILIHISDPDINTLATLNNWDGRLTPVECTNEGCSQDYFSVFEANLGVNKSNCCVDRSVKIEKTAIDNGVNSNTTIHYYNEGPGTKYVGVAGEYKAFIRLYFPEKTTINPPIIDGKSYTEYIREKKTQGYFHPITSVGFSLEKVHGLQELGLWVIVHPEQELTVQIHSTIPFQSAQPYSLVLQKQPGTLPDFNNFSITFNNNNLFTGELTTDKKVY